MIRYFEKSIENMRDIGGYKSGTKNKVVHGKIIRSNLPKKLSDNDILDLEKMGINTVIDLRSRQEYENKKSIFENNKNFKIYHIEIDVGRDIPEKENLVPKSYIDMLTLYEKIRNFFEILANNEGILYFCNAGKDRTGVITALILKLLGVNDEDIINDYMITKELMSEILNKYAEHNDDIINIITPKRYYMEEFLTKFTGKYKGIENYLTLIGVKDKVIDQIKLKYIE